MAPTWNNHRCRGNADAIPGKTSGWGGIRTHERLSPLPVFKVGEGLPCTPEGISLENECETLLKPSSTGSRDHGPKGEIETNRDTTSQIETTHGTIHRQVATCLSRIDSKWRSFASFPSLPYFRIGFEHHWLRGLPDALRPWFAAMARAFGGRRRGTRRAVGDVSDGRPVIPVVGSRNQPRRRAPIARGGTPRRAALLI
jgi:hypothetical protein